MQCSQVVATHIPSRCRCMACMVMAPPAADDPFAALASCPISAAAAAGAASGHWVLLGRHRYCPLLALLRSVAARELTAPACSCATQLWSPCDWCSPGAVSPAVVPLCATLGCKPAGPRLGLAGASVPDSLAASEGLAGQHRSGPTCRVPTCREGSTGPGLLLLAKAQWSLAMRCWPEASKKMAGHSTARATAGAVYSKMRTAAFRMLSQSAASAAPHCARCVQCMPATIAGLLLLPPPLPAVAQQQGTGLASPLWRCLVSWAGSLRL